MWCRRVVLGVVLGLVLGIGLLPGLSQGAWAQGLLVNDGHRCVEPVRTIHVSGKAEINVVPDEVVISLGVETSNLKLSAAKTENDAAISNLLALAKRYGIEDKYVQTDHITLEPRYDHSYSEKDFVGYFVRKGIQVTLKDMGKFDAFLSDALEGGVTNIHGVEFKTTELRKHRDKARLMAITAAKEKAEALTGALGQTIGRPTSINEANVGWWYGGYNGWGSSHSRGMVQNVMQNAGGGGTSGETTALGQIKVEAEVTVTFEIQDAQE